MPSTDDRFSHRQQEPLIIASRGSALALWQAEHVQALLAQKLGLSSEIKVIKTTGDRIQDQPLHAIGGKGLFIKEIEQALLEGKADLGVHSLKDMPVRLPSGCTLAAILARHGSGDALVFSPQKNLPLPLPSLVRPDWLKKWQPLRLATGSLRRASLLQEAARANDQEISVEPLRGNVDTRLSKLLEADWDGIILAEAALGRLGVPKGYTALQFDPEWFVPSPGQGALALEVRKDRVALLKALQPLACPQTALAVNLERAVLRGFGGDCTLPIGVHARWLEGGQLSLAAVLLDLTGNSVRHRVVWDWPQGSEGAAFYEAKARSFIQAMVVKGANEILQNLGLDPV